MILETLPVTKCKAIVMFGPATPASGTRPGTFFQVTIDPAMVSPKGDFIRFGANPGDEIQGWQKIDGLTVCEVLGEYNEDGTYPEADGKDEPLFMRMLA